MCIYMCTVWQNPEEGIRSPDLKLGMGISLGTEPRPSTRAATALTSWAMSHAPAPHQEFYIDIHERAWPLLFPSCNVLIRILYQNNADLKNRTINYVRKHHPPVPGRTLVRLALVLAWMISKCVSKPLRQEFIVGFKVSLRLWPFWFGKLFVQEIACYSYVFKSVFHIFPCLGNIQRYNLFHFWVRYVLPPLWRGGVRSYLFSRELAFGQSFFTVCLFWILLISWFLIYYDPQPLLT